jgi:hypothetical protein
MPDMPLSDERGAAEAPGGDGRHEAEPRLPVDPQNDEPVAIRPELLRLYRAEALAQYQKGRTDEGHPLEIEPVWMRLADGLIAVVIVAALIVAIRYAAIWLPFVRGGE